MKIVFWSFLISLGVVLIWAYTVWWMEKMTGG